MKQSHQHKELMRALKDMSFNKFRKILKENLGCINDVDTDGCTALIFAAAKGTQTLVQELIDRKANLNIQNSKSDSALISAVHGGYVACVDMLIAAGADLNIRNSDGTALENAIKMGREDCVVSLIKAGSPLECLSNEALDRYEGIIKQYYPEKWEIANKVREAEKGVCENFSAYDMVNDFIVLKCEGASPVLGKIHTMFNFRARTVTEVIGRTPGTPREFDNINPNDMGEIVAAYDFSVWKGKKNASPVKRPSVVKIKT